MKRDISHRAEILLRAVETSGGRAKVAGILERKYVEELIAAKLVTFEEEPGINPHGFCGILMRVP
jgi:hypothetical protein